MQLCAWAQDDGAVTCSGVAAGASYPALHKHGPALHKHGYNSAHLIPGIVIDVSATFVATTINL